jgi:hypothetical protein
LVELGRELDDETSPFSRSFPPAVVAISSGGSACNRLPLVAPTGLHNCSYGRYSISGALVRLQKPARGARLCAQGSAMTMNSDTVSVLEGNTFVVGGRNGDVDAGPGQPRGLFHRTYSLIRRGSSAEPAPCG